MAPIVTKEMKTNESSNRGATETKNEHREKGKKRKKKEKENRINTRKI